MAKKKSSTKVEEETYEVEHIVDHKKEKGKLQFFVKWKGYESSENTWEFEKNLQGCPEILAEYKKLMVVEDEPEVKLNSSPKKSAASPKKRRSTGTKSPSKRAKKEEVAWTESDVSVVKEMDRIGNDIEVTLVLKKNHTVVKSMLSDVRQRCPQKYLLLLT